MDDKHFDELLESVRDMGRHMRGEALAGAKLREFPEPDVKAIRERIGLSQTRFAYQARLLDTHFVIPFARRRESWAAVRRSRVRRRRARGCK
jgi:hypothetical protein